MVYVSSGISGSLVVSFFCEASICVVVDVDVDMSEEGLVVSVKNQLSRVKLVDEGKRQRGHCEDLNLTGSFQNYKVWKLGWDEVG